MRPRSIRGPVPLLLPGSALLVFLLVLPLLYVAEQSFREYVPGRIGAAQDSPYTLHNYLELVHPVYLRYLAAMIRIGLLSTLAGVALAYPIAYFIARRRAGRLRTIALGFLVAFLFLSVLVRVYSLELSFGPVGLGPVLSALLGVSRNSREYAEFLVIIGLMHHNVPLSALLLIGTIQNVNPRLAEAAQALGAPRWKAHLSTTVTLSVRGLLAAFLINYTIAISAFVIPMVLGKGKVLFMSNLIYDRFGELTNYPSGAAIAIQLLVLAFAMIYGITRLALARWERT
jgi:ABC-type spermidine/putrescine transport system permease subunit I